MAGQDPRKTNLRPKDPKNKKYMDKKTGDKIIKLSEEDAKEIKENQIPTRLQKKETTIDRVNLKGGGICKKGMNPKARGRNS